MRRVFLAFVAACLPGIPGVSAAQEAGLLEEGRALYEDKCAQCHGVEGDGGGVAAPRLLPRPRDFTSGSFKIRTTPSGELPTDSDLISILRRGMPYTAMPAWSSLRDEQVDALVAYIKTFNEDFADPDMIVPPLEVPQAPRLTEESVASGRQVYLENKCYECHGDQGRADGESAPRLADDAGLPIRPADLTQRWSFRGGTRREDIYRTFTTGLNGTPMPSYADSIAEQQRWQLVDYVYSLSRDEPGYASLVIAKHVETEIALDPRSPAFAAVEPALLPMAPQLIDPGRSFVPGTNVVSVRAVYDSEVLSVQLSWSSMLAQREGSNRPDGRDPPVPGVVLSDAVALQLPSTVKAGPAKPYFLYGDPAHAVELAFYDAGADAATVYLGRGEASLAPATLENGQAIRARGVFEQGLWQVVFQVPRRSAAGELDPRFAEAAFVPIAVSVWDASAGETGNRRAITSWFPLYLDPPETGAAYTAAGSLALITLIGELLLVAGVRRAQRGREPQHPGGE